MRSSVFCVINHCSTSSSSFNWPKVQQKHKRDYTIATNTLNMQLRAHLQTHSEYCFQSRQALENHAHQIAQQRKNLLFLRKQYLCTPEWYNDMHITGLIPNQESEILPCLSQSSSIFSNSSNVFVHCSQSSESTCRAMELEKQNRTEIHSMMEFVSAEIHLNLWSTIEWFTVKQKWTIFSCFMLNILIFVSNHSIGWKRNNEYFLNEFSKPHPQIITETENHRNKFSGKKNLDNILFRWFFSFKSVTNGLAWWIFDSLHKLILGCLTILKKTRSYQI